MTTTFVTPDKSLLGTVKVDKFPFEDSEIGVYQTDQLKSLIGVLGDDVSLDLSKFGDKAVSLKVKNGPVSVDYVLSDLSVIADPPALKRLPEFGSQIKLDNNFINTFSTKSTKHVKSLLRDTEESLKSLLSPSNSF